MARITLVVILLVIVVFVGVFAVLGWRSEIAAVNPPARTSFDQASISRGATLAAMGDCVSCHTAPEGRPFAGGYPIHTQFGTIYGSNITPDPETGIGRWSLAAFTRAVREGVDREGDHLYPAFPYEHFTLLADEDIAALYAYLMTREPVRAEKPPNDLVLPLNARILLSGWKLLFFEPAQFRSNPSQSAEWNRGAYLAQGLAHCGACHTPRNVLGAEKKRFRLAGGEAEAWRAPPINETSRAPVPWTAETVFRYLRYGTEERHETAAGPMAPVVHNLSSVPEGEVRAIAEYVAAVMGAADSDRERRGEQAMTAARRAAESVVIEAPAPQRQVNGANEQQMQLGAMLYAGTCATCHTSAERPPGSSAANALHLALSTSLSAATPANLVRIIMYGLAPPAGERGPLMPGFADALTEEQIAALVTYLRATYSDRPEWRDVEREVRKVRHAQQ